MKRLGAEDPRWIGDFRLLGRLGEGGMGRVYLARSKRGRTVAVKAVQNELARQPDFRRRFAQEITAARKVGGEWTAPVLDADTEAETPWVATGYIAGPSLAEVVDEQFGPLPVESVMALASGLVRALHDIHRAGLVHRDLKPSNVLITIDGPRVIDFGIARALDSAVQSAGGLTRTGALVGSPGFMSPEQVRGLQTTPASDIFCLGAVLAYAATGRMPFGTADSGVHALLFRIAEEEPELSGLDGPLLDLVAACLAKPPAERPTLEALLERTEGGLKGTWLPGEVLAQLGRHAVQLLDSEDPETVEQPGQAAAGTAPAGAAPGGMTPGGMAPAGTAAAGTAPGGTPSTPPPGPSAPSTPPHGPAAPSAPSTPPPSGGYGPPASSPYSTPPGQQQWQPGFPGQAQGAPQGPAPGPAAMPHQPGRPPQPPQPNQPNQGAQPNKPALAARSARKLSQSITVLMSLHLLVAVIAVIVEIGVLNTLSDAEARYIYTFNLERINGYGGLQGATIAVEVIAFLLTVTLIVLWLTWFWRMRANAETFAPGQVRYSTAMSVWCWFIPVCNLFMPKQIINDVWPASDPSAQWYGYGPRPRTRRGVVTAWWTTWVIYSFFFTGDWESWYEQDSLDSAQQTAALALFGDMFSIPAAILAIVVVSRLTAMQDERLSGRTA
jgi:eukaryotic-like serine/threonine-protein kinase